MTDQTRWLELTFPDGATRRWEADASLRWGYQMESEPVQRVYTEAEVTVPDLTWSWTDPAGHEHRWVPTRHPEAEVPTALIRSVHHECDGSHRYGYEPDGDCEGWDEPVLHCQGCDAVVEPRRVGTGRNYVDVTTGPVTGVLHLAGAFVELARLAGYEREGNGWIARASSRPPLVQVVLCDPPRWPEPLGGALTASNGGETHMSIGSDPEFSLELAGPLLQAHPQLLPQ